MYSDQTVSELYGVLKQIIMTYIVSYKNYSVFNQSFSYGNEHKTTRQVNSTDVCVHSHR